MMLRDARRLTPDVKAELEAMALLQILYARPMPESAVRAAVQKHATLTEAARQKALELAGRFGGKPRNGITSPPGLFFAIRTPMSS